MTDDRQHERRLRRLSETAHTRVPPDQRDPGADEDEDRDHDPGQRLDQQALWVDHQIRQAQRRGDFDDLPGAGKPIPGIDRPHDPDWWVKSLVRRERLTGIAPPALSLRGEDAGLDDRLDRLGSESEVRRVLEDFNARVLEARRQLMGGPPVVTAPRDVDAAVAAWQVRRAERRQAQRVATERAQAEAAREAAEHRAAARRRRWYRRALRRLRGGQTPR